MRLQISSASTTPAEMSEDSRCAGQGPHPSFDDGRRLSLRKRSISRIASVKLDHKGSFPRSIF